MIHNYTWVLGNVNLDRSRNRRKDYIGGVVPMRAVACAHERMSSWMAGSDRPELYFVPWVQVVGADLTRRIQSNQPSNPLNFLCKCYYLT